MTAHGRGWVLCLALLAGGVCLAEDGPTPAAQVGPAATSDDVLRDGRGVWTHDGLRYGRRWNLVGGLALRTLMDLVAIPSGMVGWDGLDWTVFSSVVASTVLLSLPTSPSPDVLLQRAIQRTLGPNRFTLWTPYGDMAIWMGIWGGVASMFLYGLAADAPEFVEVSALAVEAFAVAQVYHLGIKALTGREGPQSAVTAGESTGEGRYLGPAAFPRLFPAGTPSGHVATMYAIASVVMHYFNTPALWISLNTAALLFSLTIIADNYHWASDVIVGAALGFCVGRWVVHHRSTRYRNDAGGLPRRVLATVANHATLAPMLVPGGGLGASVVVRF
jgi:membrane-associated phospholipid phosphatase